MHNSVESSVVLGYTKSKEYLQRGLESYRPSIKKPVFDNPEEYMLDIALTGPIETGILHTILSLLELHNFRIEHITPEGIKSRFMTENVVTYLTTIADLEARMKALKDEVRAHLIQH